MSEGAFKIDVTGLKSRNKVATPQQETAIEEISDKHGFTAREPKKKRGRPKSPRTGQVHAKVMPDVATSISDEAKRRGCQQGVLIEEAWALYQKANAIQ